MNQMVKLIELPKVIPDKFLLRKEFVKFAASN